MTASFFISKPWWLPLLPPSGSALCGTIPGSENVSPLLRDVGIAILWNSESSLPTGLLPTILDGAIGMPSQRWLDVAPFDEGLYASRNQQPTDDAGADASNATAAPQ